MPPLNKQRISLLDYAHVLVRWKKKIIVNFIVVSIIAVLISLIVPKTYTATTTILPATESADFMGLSSILSDLPAIGGLGGITNLSGEGMTLMAILNSRTMYDSVIQKFNLRELYKMPTLVETRKVLQKNVSSAPTEEGTIRLAVDAKTHYFSFGQRDNSAKNLCCDMANYFISQLDTMNKRLRVEKGRNHRIFIERRYQQSLQDLENAENEFNFFQKKYGVIAIEEQTKAAIDVIAQLKGLLTSKEVEVEVMKQYVSDTHAELKKAQRELLALKDKYKEFMQASEDSVQEKNTDIFLPIDNIPDIGLEYARLYRELMIQEKIQEFLVPLFEQAKIQEAKDTPSLQIIDRAIVPDKKSKPKRAVIVVFAAFTSLLFMAVLAYLNVNLNVLKETNPATYQKLNTIFSELFQKKIN